VAESLPSEELHAVFLPADTPEEIVEDEGESSQSVTQLSDLTASPEVSEDDDQNIDLKNLVHPYSGWIVI